MSDTKTFIGYTPKPWQRVVHNAITAAGPKAGKIFCVKAKRQIGKSFIIEQELLRHAINFRNSINICVSLTYSNCRKIYKELANGIIGTGIVKKANDSAMELTLFNDSMIIFKSAVQKEALRGYTIKNGGILCIDEAAYIKDEIFNIISPWVDVNSANILMVSTPRYKMGFFYNYYMEGLTIPNGDVISFDLCQYDTSEFLSPKKLELYRKLFPRGQFTSEYLGEFIDEGGGVFEITNDIWWKNGNTNVLISKREEYSELFIGIDWGSGKNNDYTVVSGVDATGTQHALSYFNGKSPIQQIEYIKQIIFEKLDPKKIKAVVCETNSIGNIYIDMLKKALPNIKIIEFTTTNDSKREVIEYLIKRIGEAKIKLIRNEEQYREFSLYEMELTSSGKITYNGAAGVHDDMVMATAFAFKPIKDLESTSNYNISFAHKQTNHHTQLRNKYN